MSKINFSLCTCLIDTKDLQNNGVRYTPLNINHLSSETLEWNYTKENTDELYRIRIEKKLNYFWMHIEYGSSKPRRKKIVHTETNYERDNQRTSEEVELGNQLFFLYDFDNLFGYISNQQKKGLIEDIIKKQYNITFLIKDVFGDIADFTQKLSELKEISFTGVNDLFFGNSNIKSSLINILGTDSPERFTLKASYKGHIISNFIMKLFTAQENKEIRSLIIRGKDSSGVDTVFNTNLFTKKYAIFCEKDSEEFIFPPNEVLKKLLQKIGDIDDEA